MPIKFSKGFNPRVQLSFALPLGVGVTSDSEYVDLELEDEQKKEEKRIQSNYTVGEFVLYKGKKYPIENISDSTGKLCINRGTFVGYAWVFPEEVSKVEE